MRAANAAMRPQARATGSGSTASGGVLGGAAPRSMKRADPRKFTDLRKHLHPRTNQSRAKFLSSMEPCGAEQLPMGRARVYP